MADRLSFALAVELTFVSRLAREARTDPTALPILADWLAERGIVLPPNRPLSRLVERSTSRKEFRAAVAGIHSAVRRWLLAL